MRTPDQIAADVDPSKRPFSNHSEFDLWAARNCYRCVNDDEAAEKYCPVLSAALGGSGWPKGWTRRTHTWQTAGGSGSYEVVDTCTDFEERRRGGGGEPKPRPPAPQCDGQLDIVDAYLDTAIGELSKAPEGMPA